MPKINQKGHKKQEASAEKIGPASKPLSLAPLSLNEALEGLLQVRPPKKEKRPQLKKASAKKR